MKFFKVARYYGGETSLSRRWAVGFLGCRKKVGSCLGGILCLLLSLVVATASAEKVSQKQAMKIAETFFNAAYGEYTPPPKMIWNGRQLTTQRLFSPFYIYNHPRGGFVIISAENKAFPVLGYSLTNSFDRDKLKDDEIELLTRYAREVEVIRYDGRSPERAIAAWQNLPKAIDEALRIPYSTPEFARLTEEEKENIETIDRRNGWVMMPTAVEFDIYRPDDYRDYTLEDTLGEEAEEAPFSFYENFIREIEEEERQRLAALDEIIAPTVPVVKNLGGAHYAISFPEEIKMVRVYSPSGSRMLENYYDSGNVANLDLSVLPAGFYIVMALRKDGFIHGLKIAR